MSANTKILVLHSKALIYTLLLLIAAIATIIILFSFLTPTDASSAAPAPSQSEEPQTEVSYIPGVYSASVQLGSSGSELKVYVNRTHILAMELVNTDEAITTMYPLMEPTFDALSSKILEAQSVEQITYDTDNKYTSLLLLNAISTAINKAVEKPDTSASVLY